MKRFFALLLIASLLFLFGCQTVQGLGKDIENAGTWIQNKANR